MCLWRFVHGEVFPWRFFYCSHFWRFSLWNFFNSWRFFRGVFFFFWDCYIVNICSMLTLRLKNCFSLLVLRLKIFVLVIWLRIIGLVSDIKTDANLGLEFGILIDSGSYLRFEMIVDFGHLYGLAFCTIELILLFLNVSLKWVWWMLCDHGYDWVCFIEMGMAKLDWFLPKFCNFWG